MSDEIIPQIGETWQHKQSGRIVVIVEELTDVHRRTPHVWYKAVKRPVGQSHVATTKMFRDRFLKAFRRAVATEAPPTLFQPSTGMEVPIAAPAPFVGNGSVHGILSAIASQLCLRARSLVGDADLDQRRDALMDVAEAIQEMLDGRTIDRAMFLSWNVTSLLVNLKLAADHSEARSAIIDGLVYIDGEQVTDSDAPITRATRDRFTIRCGDETKIVKVVG